jgi:hypothetical protein
MPVMKIMREILESLMPLGRALQTEQVNVGTSLILLHTVINNFVVVQQELQTQLDVARVPS